jgi:hypothetical protein
MKIREREPGFQRRCSCPMPAKCRRGIRMSGIVLSVFLVLFLWGGATGAEKSDFQFKKQPEIQQVKPQKPVKIKLHRNAKGEYSWELSGDNVDEIVNTDRKLRRLLKIQ